MTMQIAHHSNVIMVECTTHYSNDVVEAFVCRETQEDGWQMRERWVITFGEYSYLQDNPHRNSRGLWMYLLERKMSGER